MVRSGGARCRELRLACVVARRAHQCRVASGRGAVHVRGVVPVLQPVHRQQDFRARSRAPDSRGSAERRQRFHADQPVDRLRPPFRGDRGAGPACRADSRGAIRISPRRALDHRRRRDRRSRAGLRDPLRFGAARRQIAGSDGEGGDRAGRGIHGAGCGARDHDRIDRGACAGGRERAEGESVGCRDDRSHDSDCTHHGRVSALDQAASRARGERDRAGAADSRAICRAMGGAESRDRADVHADRARRWRC